jgi:hypothetical protein
LWARGLLIRRNIADGEMAYLTTWCPAGTSSETLVAVEGHRWAVEDGFEVAKTELGLDHNETRSWHGWHRHVSLVMLAFAMLATIRYLANCGKSAAKVTNTYLNPWCVGPCRESIASPYVSHNDVLSRPMSSLGRCDQIRCGELRRYRR